MSDLTDAQIDMLESNDGVDPAELPAAMLDAMLEEIRRHRAAQAASKERVREVVRSSVVDVLSRLPTNVGGKNYGPVSDAIASRVADQLATPAVLSAEEIRGMQLMRRHLDEGGHDWREGTAMADVEAARFALDRLLGGKP